LYFEPLTTEDVLEIVHAEKANGTLKGVIVQFGGQTPLKLAGDLAAAGVPILGTSPDAIDLAEDRERFQQLLAKVNLKQPPNGIAFTAEESEIVAEELGYPVVIRPSYVLGGRAMEIVRDRTSLRRYIGEAVRLSAGNPVLIDGYLENAIEIDVDAIADGTDVFVAGIMEHIEEAGIHSGDSACSLPPYSLTDKTIAELRRQAEILARALNVVGLMNIQFALKSDEIFILEVNPRASRTVPFVAKAIGKPIAKIASRIMAGEKLADFDLTMTSPQHVAVKEAVFPFARFPMGIDTNFERAFAKSQIASGTTLPQSGKVFVSVRDSDKPLLEDAVRQLIDLGFGIVATRGTAAYLSDAGIAVERVNKVLEGRPHIVDAMKNSDIQLVFNTTDGSQAVADSFTLRRTALTHGICAKAALMSPRCNPISNARK